MGVGFLEGPGLLPFYADLAGKGTFTVLRRFPDGHFYRFTYRTLTQNFAPGALRGRPHTPHADASTSRHHSRCCARKTCTRLRGEELCAHVQRSDDGEQLPLSRGSLWLANSSAGTIMMG